MTIQIKHTVIRQFCPVRFNRPRRNFVGIKCGHHRLGEPRDTVIGKIFYMLRNQTVVQGTFRAINYRIAVIAFVGWVVGINDFIGRIVAVSDIHANQDQHGQ
ncbi:hypothetical protein D3C76_1390730 [compost metagenome]